MGAPVKPEPSADQIKANLAALRAQGAPDDVIDRYMASVGARPADGPAPAPSAPAGPPTPEVGHLEGLGQHAVQGATLGFGEEAEAAMSAFNPAALGNALAAKIKGEPGSNPIANYQQKRDQLRERLKAYSSEHPIAAGAAEFAGGMVPALAIPGGGLAGTVRGAAVAGAGFGAASGLGHGEGDMGKQLKGAGIGAAAGGATAGALSALATPLENVGGAMLTRLNMRPEKSKFGIEGTEDIARRFVRKQFERDGIETASQVTPGVGPEVVADKGGTMVKRTIGGLQSLPSRAANKISKQLEERTKGQFTRVTDDLGTIMNVPPEDADRIAADLVTSKYQRSKPLYDKAYTDGKMVDDPEINRMLGRPEFRQAWLEARKTANLEDKPLPKIFKRFRTTDAKGNVKIEWRQVAKPDLRTLDYIKRELDGTIKVGKKALGQGGMKSTHAKALEGQRNQLVSRLDALVPSYRAARDDFATASSAEDALENGLNIFRQQQRLTTDDVQAMSNADREMYLVGAFRAVRDRLAKMNDKADITKVLNNPDVREQLETVARQPGEFDAIMEMLTRETGMAETAGAIQGSRTTPIAAMQAEIENASPDVVTALGSLVQGKWGRAASQGARSLFTRQNTHPAGGVAEKAADMLMQPASPQNMQSIFQPEQMRGSISPRVIGATAGQLAAPQLSSNPQTAQAEAVQARAAGIDNATLEQQLSQRYTPEVVRFIIAATPQRVPQQ
jgi:hypothetical protein